MSKKHSSEKVTISSRAKKDKNVQEIIDKSTRPQLRCSINQSASSLRKEFVKEYSHLTQLIYIASYFSAQIRINDSKEIADNLNSALKNMVHPEDARWNSAIVGNRAKISKAAKRFPRDLMELLVVRLDAFLHGVLNDLHRPLLAVKPETKNERDAAFESDLTELRRLYPKCYRGIILLAEIRNAIVHNQSVLDECRFQRLSDSGWSKEDFRRWQLRLAEGLTLSELLQWKGAVRTAANLAFEEHGSFPDKKYEQLRQQDNCQEL